MILKSLVRLTICLVISLILGALGEKDIPSELPKTLFDVQGILFPVALALATSMDLLRVRNTKLRAEFRANIKRVRNSLIIQFIFACSAIGITLLLKDTATLKFKDIIVVFPRLTASISISYSILHTIYNFIAMQRFKEDIEDKLQKEGK